MINKHGVDVNVGDHWTLDNTFVLQIIAIRNGVASLSSINLQNGSRGTSNRIVTDFGQLKVLRPSTSEEIAFYIANK